jgi:hypothetical protein
MSVGIDASVSLPTSSTLEGFFISVAMEASGTYGALRNGVLISIFASFAML